MTNQGKIVLIILLSLFMGMLGFMMMAVASGSTLVGIIAGVSTALLFPLIFIWVSHNFTPPR